MKKYIIYIQEVLGKRDVSEIVRQIIILIAHDAFKDSDHLTFYIDFNSWVDDKIEELNNVIR